MRLRAVLLDLDGTLADTLPGLTLTANRMRARHGLPAVGPGVVRMWVGEGAARFAARAMTGQRDGTLPDAALATALADFHALYAECQNHRLRLYAGAAQALGALHAARVPLACITNKPRRHAAAMLDALRIAGFFAALVTPEDGHGSKPSAAPLLAACRALDVPPRGAVVVGDAMPDILAARAAGCAVVTVRYGYGGIGAAQADASVTSLAELPHVAIAVRLRRAAAAAGSASTHGGRT
jgi:phosphoglycolate phosphatase